MEQHEAIIQKLLEHDDRFDRLEEKTSRDKDEILTAIDRTMVILQRLDQERIFTHEWIRRLETEVKDHTKEIKRIKHVLKI